MVYLCLPLENGWFQFVLGVIDGEAIEKHGFTSLEGCGFGF